MMHSQKEDAMRKAFDKEMARRSEVLALEMCGEVTNGQPPCCFKHRPALLTV